MSTSISSQTVKLLWGFSGNRCSLPECRQHLIIESADPGHPHKPIGEMAHISAKKKGSPRYDDSLTDSQRNGYANLILLCPSCHAKIDADANAYPIEILHQIKKDHLDWIAKSLAELAPDVSFVELEAVAKYIISGQAVDDTSYDLITVKDKISRNSLSEQAEGMIKIGLSRSKEVKSYLDYHPDAQFGARLSAGFVAEYDLQHRAGISGDALFLTLVDYAAGKSTDDMRRVAGLVVLVYLFEACEVFEK